MRFVGGARQNGGMRDHILEALDPEQRRVATLLDAPVVVLAGAGTGKTRAITHRIAHAVSQGRYQPSATLAGEGAPLARKPVAGREVDPG